MLRHRTALAAVLAIALVVVPSAEAKGKKKGSHFDLKVTQIVVKQVPGTPKYLLLDESGNTQAFAITVKTFNYGAKVGPTHTDLKLELNGKVIWHGRAHVPALGYRDSIKHTWEIKSLHADPGLLEPVAFADATKKIDERSESNNTTAAPVISVIPRDWNVSAFQTNVDVGNGLTGGTHTDNGFYFRFSRLDESAKTFDYTGWGTIKSNASYSVAGCSGQGSDTATQTPWQGSDDGLSIKANLSQYSAGITTQALPPYMFQVNCGSASFPQQGTWANLVTWKDTYSWIPMKFSDTTLSDSGEANTPQGHATYAWTFIARLSGA